MQTVYTTREEWLIAAMNEVAVDFAILGAPLPDKIRLTCGFTSGGTRGKKLTRVGECWDASRSGDKAVEILISPVIDDPFRVLDILVHELCHAAAGIKAGHKGAFATLARGMNLEGPLTATIGGDAFRVRFGDLIANLGAYPHAALDTSTRKKQSTRMLKACCPACGYTVRLTAKWLRLGAPYCPVDRIPMSDGDSDDE